MVYVVCGLFTGLAAIAYAAVTPTVQPGTGAGLEMDAIGGVFVGGVAATGGYGSVIGTLAGIFVIMLLETGLPYIGLQANWQADHYRCSSYHCSTDRYHERKESSSKINFQN